MKTTKPCRSPRLRTARLKPQPVRWLNQVAAEDVLIPDRKSVLAYCRAYPFLARELPRIAARAREIFRPKFELYLDFYQDPEIDDRYLTLSVLTRGYDPDLMNLVEALNAELHDSWDYDLGYVLIMPDYRKPRTSTNGV